jgi:putative ABC transport system ATP-binding protein
VERGERDRAGDAGRSVRVEPPGQARTPMLALQNVVKRYRTGGKTLVALEGVDFRVDPGEFVTVMGPSGSGKTTMLNVLGLLDRPTRGSVYFMGRDVTGFDDEQRTRQRRQTVGFVFQDFHLLESMTARENVEIPALFADREDSTARARRLLERVGLGDRTDHYPDELSGGQKQRVAIARALVNEPSVVLADEPTGNLDEDTSLRILDLMSQICATGAAVVSVTHDPLVADYAERRVDVIDGQITGETRRL